MSAQIPPALVVRDLVVEFTNARGRLRAVDSVSFDVAPGEIVGIAGESGSGKSVTVSTILGLNREQASYIGGSIDFGGIDLVSLPENQMRSIRGSRIAIIPQNPMTAFNPVRTIGVQMTEAVRIHDKKINKADARAKVVEALRRAGIPTPERRLDHYPHEFSGGMRQRAIIAMAILNDPEIIIADEPTTALDVTIQAQILDLLKEVRDLTGAAVLIITHDLGVLAEIADRVIMMYASRVVEIAPVHELYDSPKHPYSRELQACLPSLYEPHQELAAIPGMPPMLSMLPTGCAFNPRCSMSNGTTCVTEKPALREVGEGHVSACHRSDEVGDFVVATRELAR
jgi:oligopeptide/dipeptide ABC transporter ATP-binding protein